MNAEKKLYTTKEVMRILGVTNNSGFFRKIKRHGIHPEKRSCFCYFTDEMIDDLKKKEVPDGLRLKLKRKDREKERPPQEKKRVQDTVGVCPSGMMSLWGTLL